MAIIKHANPCGIAVSSVSVADAHRKAHECDPLSAFGGVIAANTEVSVEMAEYVSTIFTEVIVAPGLRTGRRRGAGAQEERPGAGRREPLAPGGADTERRQISGGLLVQQRDQIDAAGDDPNNWTLATGDRGRPGHAGRSGRSPGGPVVR